MSQPIIKNQDLKVLYSKISQFIRNIIAFLIGLLIALLPIILSIDIEIYFIVVLSVVLFLATIILFKPYRILSLLILIIPIQNLLITLLNWNNILPDSINLILNGIKELLVLIVFFSFLLNFKLKIKPSSFTKLDLVFLGYIIWPILYFIFPIGSAIASPLQTQIFGYRLIILPAIFYFLGRLSNISRYKFIGLLRIFLIIGFLTAIFGIFERLFVPIPVMEHAHKVLNSAKGQYENIQMTGMWASFGGDIWIRRLGSTFIMPLIMGYFGVFLVPLTLVAWIYGSKLGLINNKIIGCFSFLLVGSSQLLTLTRGPLIANIIGFLVLWFILYPPRRVISLIIISGILLTIITPLGQRIVGSTITLTDNSARNRVFTTQVGLDTLSKFPFGLGLGYGGYVGINFLEEDLGVLKSSLGHESFYFSIASQTGLPTLLLFIVSLLLMWVSLYKIIHVHDNDIFIRVISTVCLASSLGYAVTSLISETPQGFLSSSIAWIFTGITISLFKRNHLINRGFQNLKSI